MFQGLREWFYDLTCERPLFKNPVGGIIKSRALFSSFHNIICYGTLFSQEVWFICSLDTFSLCKYAFGFSVIILDLNALAHIDRGRRLKGSLLHTFKHTRSTEKSTFTSIHKYSMYLLHMFYSLPWVSLEYLLLFFFKLVFPWVFISIFTTAVVLVWVTFAIRIIRWHAWECSYDPTEFRLQSRFSQQCPRGPEQGSKSRFNSPKSEAKGDCSIARLSKSVYSQDSSD